MFLQRQHLYVDLGKVADQTQEMARLEHIEALPYYINRHARFYPCKWCEYEPPHPAVLTWSWWENDYSNNDTSCVACSHDVINHALRDAEHHHISVNYPVLLPEEAA